MSTPRTARRRRCPISSPLPNGPGPYYFSDWPQHYDYVLILLFTRPDTPNPDPARFVPVFQGQHFQLYKVIKSD